VFVPKQKLHVMTILLKMSHRLQYSFVAKLLIVSRMSVGGPLADIKQSLMRVS